MTKTCPVCKRPGLELTSVKVVDAESTRIEQVVLCSLCEFAEEVWTLLNLKRA